MEKLNPIPEQPSGQLKENLMITLRGRRIQNFKNQFKAVVLEGYEIFGSEIVEDVIKECREIFIEYESLMSSE